ncbi:MAG TPA: helix-turn-helix domain-containing protein [Gemmatimonadales bacterium]|jgi:ArsR family transcriptional regulator, arsenate/arsenite/antimonite-responsive transcriptional repressor|nr:helix-turn-helix domain-containing protein [Gemmatimonadales bacterium]
MMTRLRPALGGTQFDLIAKALADPRRMALLESIAGVEECPCQRLRRQFSISKATISHHIKELVRAGLVESWREGQYLHCEVRRDVLEAYTSELMRRVGAGVAAGGEGR